MTVHDHRQQIHDELADRIRTCTKCDGMNKPLETQSSPGYGDIESPVVVVGQSLCGPCMKEQQPFFGGSGKHLDEALDRAGHDKEDIYTTNVVHCHPKKMLRPNRNGSTIAHRICVKNLRSCSPASRSVSATTPTTLCDRSSPIRRRWTGR